MKSVYLSKYSLVREITLADGSLGLHLQLTDEEAEKLRGAADFIEGDDWDTKCPDKWKTREGSPRHLIAGHDPSRITLPENM